MAKRFHLDATARTSSARAVRRRDTLPAVLYGHDIKNHVLSLDQRSFAQVFKEAGYTTLINISLTDAKDSASEHTVLIREVQFHPVRENMLHVDLYQVRMDEVIRTRVPLAFIGEAPAVKDLGGVLVRNMDEIELEALPNDLPRSIEVDVTSMKAFDTPIRVRDLSVPDEVKLLPEQDEVVTLVQPPRTEEELEAELAEEVTEDVTTVEGVEEEPAEGAEEKTETAEGDEKEDKQDKKKPSEATS